MDDEIKKKSGPTPKDIVGQKFERLTASMYLSGGMWLCDCDCGETTVVAGSDLRRGKVRSCGCLQLEIARSGECRRIHGMSNSPEYRSWSAMIRRCTDDRAMGYSRYGGRGIKVCDRWIESFENFYADMGVRPKGTTLDRIDFDGNYELENCRWATVDVQRQNTSRTILVTANGKSQSLGAWARELGVSDKSIRYRLKIGMTDDEAINTPFRKQKYTTW
jgi:hypothetical protein